MRYCWQFHGFPDGSSGLIQLLPGFLLSQCTDGIGIQLPAPGLGRQNFMEGAWSAQIFQSHQILGERGKNIPASHPNSFPSLLFPTPGRPSPKKTTREAPQGSWKPKERPRQFYLHQLCTKKRDSSCHDPTPFPCFPPSQDSPGAPGSGWASPGTRKEP